MSNKTLGLGRRSKALRLAGLLILLFCASKHLDSTFFFRGGAFETSVITGFANIDTQHDHGCVELATVNHLNSIHNAVIDDDLYRLAGTISHPLIKYSTEDKVQSFQATVDRTWSRMSASSVWLEEQQVYLTVSRVFFYAMGVKRYSIISFLRAQIHDAKWNHLTDYDLNWNGNTISFPRFFDIATPWESGGCFYGPEDPRIIIERGVHNAEPVIVFNMLYNTETKQRRIHIFRPFSNVTVPLLLEDPRQDEKNWAPFFLETNGSDGKRKHSTWLHFLYEVNPLKVVRCHLFSGECSRIFERKSPQPYLTNAERGVDYISGGSNLEPLGTNLFGIASFVGFPRTHIEEGCLEDAMYRPELMILSTNGENFWIEYMSGPLSLGTSILSPVQFSDPCVTGRILQISSIARFDTTTRSDEMVVSYSVNDESVGSATIQGVRELFEHLPQFQGAAREDSEVSLSMDRTYRIVACSIESAKEYALNHTTQQMGVQEQRPIANG